ncbi:globin family protein [Falsiroseomonas sp. HW251]|uniref:globin family protein n=1 Tax=Falsiroseomonas sp. HW251 TaxID=3390998 RepID=UPI003D310572
MTPADIQLVEASFRLVAPIAEPAAAIFYEKLFALDPTLRPMFAHGDMHEQGRKLMQALGFVVGNLRAPEKLLPVVADLGRRHAGYGVQAGHYGTVGAALLATLREGLGPHFTPEVAAAWEAAYALLSAVMLDSAAPAQAA